MLITQPLDKPRGMGYYNDVLNQPLMPSASEINCWELLIDIYFSIADYLSLSESATDVMLIASEDYDEEVMQHFNLTREEEAWLHLPKAPEGAIMREMGSRHGELIYEEAAEQWILDGSTGFYADFYQMQEGEWVQIPPPKDG